MTRDGDTAAFAVQHFAQARIARWLPPLVASVVRFLARVLMLFLARLLA
jgi:hypothetical protein